MAIFTKEIALLLIKEGFKLEYKTNYAWIFEDTTSLQIRIAELTKDLN